MNTRPSSFDHSTLHCVEYLIQVRSSRVKRGIRNVDLSRNKDVKMKAGIIEVLGTVQGVDEFLVDPSGVFLRGTAPNELKMKQKG